jgi:hypothetical protein
MKYCIFVERIFDDKCFNALRKFCKEHKGNVRLFCLTPVNYDLVCAEQGYTGTKKRLSNIMVGRYAILRSYADINLHVHLGLRLENINQAEIIMSAKEWMDSHNFNPKLITFGWYIFNNTSLVITDYLKLKVFNDYNHYSFHDYEYDKIYKPMMLITNIRGLFR